MVLESLYSINRRRRASDGDDTVFDRLPKIPWQTGTPSKPENRFPPGIFSSVHVVEDVEKENRRKAERERQRQEFLEWEQAGRPVPTKDILTTAEQRDRECELYATGKITLMEGAQRLGITEEYFRKLSYKWCDDHGVERRNNLPGFTPKDHKIMNAYWDGHYTAKAAAEKMGVCDDTFRQRFKRWSAMYEPDRPFIGPPHPSREAKPLTEQECVMFARVWAGEIPLSTARDTLGLTQSVASKRLAKWVKKTAPAEPRKPYVKPDDWTPSEDDVRNMRRYAAGEIDIQRLANLMNTGVYKAMKRFEEWQHEVSDTRGATT